ncbi:hypothetical protein D9757_007582 [Collybiopsis confluens]|uniref:Amino acid transporter n=1 Tax=Collybiopsis confluens TaxID=2823264 RepID=A0A8H5HEQ9_9AGAR|nr:hypothetical protein D9757_007582 [Collybiopsis confluens]
MIQNQKEDIHHADEALLASLGYKQEFKRAFTPLEVFGIAFSIIGLLPSIASVLFYAIPNGGGPAMIWGWAVASLFILTIGLAMAELASAAPTSGGLYTCSTVDANTVGSVAGIASINWGCAVQVMAAADIGSSNGFDATRGQLYGTYTAIVISHALICCLGTTVLARLQTVYVVLNVIICLAVIVALPASTPVRNSASFAMGEFVNLNGWPDGYAFIMSFLAPLWTIGAFDSSVHISEEASNAATAVPWAIVSAISIAGVLGWAINMSLAFCMGTDLEALAASPQPMAAIFNNSFGQRGTLTLWAFVILIQYMMGSSLVLAASRQTFAFSRDSALPFSSWLYRMNHYTKTPVNTVIFVAFFALLLGLLAFAGSVAINAVFSLAVTASYIAYAIPIAARWLGDNEFKPGPFSLGFMSLPISMTAVLFMFFLSIVILFPTTPQTDVPDMNYTVVVLGGVLILSLTWYYFPKYGGIHWFNGPIANIGTMGMSVKGITVGRESGAPEVEVEENDSVPEKRST